MDATLYNQKGTSAGTAKLPEAVFGLEWNADLVHQVVTAMQANQRQNNAAVKDRAAVSGTGKKPWRQKGTGRARHGSRRSPIWVGGGVAHGPAANRDFSKKINKKMKTKALYTLLSQKFRDEQMLFLDTAETDGTAKQGQALLQALAKGAKFETLNTESNPRNVFVVWPEKNEQLERSFANIPHVTFNEARNVNPLDIAQHRYIVIINPEAVANTWMARSNSVTA